MRSAKRLCAIGATALLVGGLGTAAVASVSTRAPSPKSAILSATGRAAVPAVQSDQTATFSALKAASGQVPDQVRRWITESDFYGKFGLNVSLARGRLTTASSQPVWIIPGNGYLCLWMADPADAGGLVCETTEEAAAGQLVFTQLRPGEPTKTVVALVPDDVSQVEFVSDHRSQAVSVDGNLAASSREAPGQLQYKAPFGDVTVPLPEIPR